MIVHAIVSLIIDLCIPAICQDGAICRVFAGPGCWVSKRLMIVSSASDHYPYVATQTEYRRGGGGMQ